MITIHIIRTIASTDDDIITIDKEDDTFFRVTYTDRDSRYRYTFTATRNQIIDYLYCVIDMLRIDEEPFDSIQLTLPAYPVVNVKIKSLNERVVKTLMRPLKRSLLKWLSSVRQPIDDCACPVLRRYLEQRERTLL